MNDESLELALLRRAARGGTAPRLTEQEGEAYARLERAKLVDMNVYSREWWLTAAGRIELERLEKRRFSARFLSCSWELFLALIGSGVIGGFVGYLVRWFQE